MPSSLVFAALTVAWLVVLVPMVAKHRQEVRRTADAALAARVVRRGGGHGAHPPEEVLKMTDSAQLDRDYDDRDHDGRDHDGRDHGDTSGRRYRPGRGGFDPQAAELAARARYAFRQRVVFGLLLLAVVSGLFAGFALPLAWWAHAAVDAVLLGYLGYLRRQVRIEQEVRARRVARAARVSRPATAAPPRERQQQGEHGYHPQDQAELVSAQQPVQPMPRLPEPTVPAGASVVDLDDEDPGFYELDGQAPTPYRRAVGE